MFSQVHIFPWSWDFKIGHSITYNYLWEAISVKIAKRQLKGIYRSSFATTRLVYSLTNFIERYASLVTPLIPPNGRHRNEYADRRRYWLDMLISTRNEEPRSKIKETYIKEHFSTLMEARDEYYTAQAKIQPWRPYSQKGEIPAEWAYRGEKDRMGAYPVYDTDEEGKPIPCETLSVDISPTPQKRQFLFAQAHLAREHLKMIDWHWKDRQLCGFDAKEGFDSFSQAQCQIKEEAEINVEDREYRLKSALPRWIDPLSPRTRYSSRISNPYVIETLAEEFVNSAIANEETRPGILPETGHADPIKSLRFIRLDTICQLMHNHYHYEQIARIVQRIDALHEFFGRKTHFYRDTELEEETVIRKSPAPGKP